MTVLMLAVLMLAVLVLAVLMLAVLVLAVVGVRSGRLVWEDSPLVRALTHGRVLLLDEADKAPLEVTCVLRSLLAEGQMVLADGRRVAPVGTPPAPGVLPIAEGFRAIVLANRPGFPFLGNDFFREVRPAAPAGRGRERRREGRGGGRGGGREWHKVAPTCVCVCDGRRASTSVCV